MDRKQVEIILDKFEEEHRGMAIDTYPISEFIDWLYENKYIIDDHIPEIPDPPKSKFMEEWEKFGVNHLMFLIGLGYGML